MTTSPGVSTFATNPDLPAEERAATLLRELRRGGPAVALNLADSALVDRCGAMARAGGWRVVTEPVGAGGVLAARLLKVDARPHAVVCGARPHDHGAECSPGCPTCHPVSSRPAPAGAAAELADFDVDGHRHGCTPPCAGLPGDCAGQLFAIAQDAEREVAELRAELRRLLEVGWFCVTAPGDVRHRAVPADRLEALLEGRS